MDKCYRNALFNLLLTRTDLHPVSFMELKPPATRADTSIPMVMKSWFRVTRRPLMAVGAASATYTGTVMEAKPSEGEGRGKTEWERK